MKPKVLLAALLAMSGMVSIHATAGNTSPPRFKQAIVAPVQVTADEAATLLWMREEEKLARDVYQALYAQWKQLEFLRIANAEQKHFDALGARLTQYGLVDPALPAPGEFSQQALQEVYWQMIDQGSRSYVQALTAGATIEEIDIADLIAAIDATTNLAIKRTYENLLEGSKNHLRAFVGLLRSLGVDYTPTHIDPVLFDAIIGG